MVGEMDTNGSITFQNPLNPNWLTSWTKEDIKAMQEEDPHLGDIVRLKLSRNDPPDKPMVSKANNQTRSLYNQWAYLELHDNILYRKWVPVHPHEPTHMQLVVPDILKKQILYMLHTSRADGHLGITRVLKKIRQKFYWPGHKGDIDRYCKRCLIYQSINPSLNPKRALLQQRPLYHRFEKINLDICGPFCAF